jgi:16S rRNA (guanine527-N7)-methyltransferase
LPSLAAIPFVASTRDGEIVDLGSGGGFPGIPLKICMPDVPFLLVESSRKKTLFLRHAVEELDLSRVEVVHGRAEALGSEPAHSERYQFVTARAVGHLRDLVGIAFPLLRARGRLVAFKGRGVEREVEESTHCLEDHGGRLVGIEEVKCVAGRPRVRLVIIERMGGQRI